MKPGDLTMLEPKLDLWIRRVTTWALAGLALGLVAWGFVLYV